MKYILTLISILLFSCGSKQNNESNLEEANHLSDSVLYNTIVDEEPDDYQAFYEAYFKNFSYEDIKIFEPMAYNESDYNKQLFKIMDTIVGLFKSENGFYMDKCQIEKVNIYENECTGSPVMEPTLNTNENCVYLFKGLKEYSKKQILDTIPAHLKIWVDKKKNFKFNNTSYQLRAEGKISNNTGNASWSDIEDYKLYLTSGKKSQCILEMKKFNDTTTEICWIGDLDGDEKPDFIIQSPDCYEDYRVLLFLSSYAKGNDLVKLVSIMVDSFAC